MTRRRMEIPQRWRATCLRGIDAKCRRSVVATTVKLSLDTFGTFVDWRGSIIEKAGVGKSQRHPPLEFCDADGQRVARHFASPHHRHGRTVPRPPPPPAPLVHKISQ